MAHVSKKDDIYVVRFRYQQKQFTKSLKTRSEDAAKGAMHIVSLTLHRLHTGQLRIPDGVDPGDFIVSGGTWTPPPPPSAPPQIFPTTRSLIERYLEAKNGNSAASYHSSQRTHLSHFLKFLKKRADQPCNLANRTLLEQFLRDRKKIRDGQTVNRERITLSQFYQWVNLQEDVPAFTYPAENLPVFKGSRDRDPFKTVAEIEAILARGGLNQKEILAQWESLYLTTSEIGGLLSLVKERAEDPVSFLLHAIAAYTAMRRGEVLRLRWIDVDLVHDFLIARSRKQSRTKEVVNRRIDLHPELKQHLLVWQRQRPKGQYVLSVPPTWAPLTVDQANRWFWQPMRGTDWCLDRSRNLFKIGFHSYRHSFASNLAAANVSPAIIDQWMGHTTIEMRERYRHLFPNDLRRAMEAFSLAAPTVQPENPTAGSVSLPAQE